VRVVHIHGGGGMGGGGGGVQEVLREVLVPVVHEKAVEVPSLTAQQKEQLLASELAAGCQCDDENCSCHTVPIKEVKRGGVRTHAQPRAWIPPADLT
jgi:hypothetical protein